MHSSLVRSVAFILIASLLVLLAGCGSSGPAKSVGNVATVTLSPSPVSINAGDVLQMSVSALDANKASVFNQTFTFKSTNNAIQIANNGLLCGGTWDSLTAPVNCKAATPGTSGLTTMLTATAQGVTSPAVTAYVHEQISSLSVTANTAACVSQTQTVQYTAVAKDVSGQDITAGVGTFNWSVQPGTVGTVASFTTTGAAPNTVTAKLPGIAQVNVSANSVNNINSVPVSFEECPITSIVISPAPVTFSGAGATQQMSATATDSRGAAVAQTLQWNSSTSAVATINTSGLVTAVAAGSTQLVASCTPNSCNINLNQPVYSNTVTATLPGASSTTVYATGTNTTTLVPISTSTNAAGTAITLPQTPNSFVFSPAGDKAFLGSANGMMIFDPATNTVTGTITNAPGTVLAVSTDGGEVLLTNGTPLVNSAGPVAGTELLLYNVKQNQVNILPNVANAVSGDFTPDGAKAFAVTCASTSSCTTSSLITVQPGTATASTALASGIASPTIGSQQVRVLDAGSVGYAAASGTPFFETCSPGTVNAGPAGTAPMLLTSLANGSAMIGAEAGNLDVISVTLSTNGTCNPTVTNALVQHAFASSVTPQQIIATPDSMHIYVTSNLTGQLLHYDMGAAAVAPVGLVNGAATLTGGTTPDSLSVYVGGSDNAVHHIDVASESDANQIAVSFTPDLVAVRP